MHGQTRPTKAVRLSHALVAVAVVVTLITLVGLPGRATYGARTSGDEPYYLLTALSLAHDGDLDLADEFADQAFRPFHEIPLDEQTTPVGPQARRLSPHDPLLAVLLAPAMAAGGWVAAKAVLALLAGLLAALTTWVAVRRGGVGIPVAATTIGLLGAAVPLAPFGTQVYPELPAALLVITAVAVGTGLAATASRRALGWRLSAVAALVIALPWLSVKYVPVAAALTAAVGWTNRRTLGWRPILLTGAALAVAGALYLVAHQVIYGGWTAYAAGDHFVGAGELSVVGTDPDHLGRGRRLLGLRVDRRFGLGAWAPLWLLLPAAVGAGLRNLPHRAVLLAPLGVGWLTATFLALTMHGWWVPGRQVVVVLPLAAIAVAALLDHDRRLLAVAIPAGLVGVSSWLWLAVEAMTGRRTLIVDFADTAAPGYRTVAPLLPDGMTGGTRADMVLLLWATLLLATAVWAHRRAGSPLTPRPSPPPPRRVPALVPAVAVIGTVIAVVALRDVVDGAALRAGMASAAADLPGLVLALAAFGGA
ncbi:MAG TPA: hypothetical protein VMM13_15825, partial [Euzebya sp.]|nr:hypothetical protein [Euzebya sp.]